MRYWLLAGCLEMLFTILDIVAMVTGLATPTPATTSGIIDQSGRRSVDPVSVRCYRLRFVSDEKSVLPVRRDLIRKSLFDIIQLN